MMTTMRLWPLSTVFGSGLMALLALTPTFIQEQEQEQEPRTGPSGTGHEVAGQSDPAVLDVVRRCYVDVAYGRGDLKLAREGVSPEFRSFTLSPSDTVHVMTFEPWLERIAWARKRPRTRKGGPYHRVEIRSVDVTGHLATVELDVYESDVLRLSESLGLYRHAGGWRVVTRLWTRRLPE